MVERFAAHSAQSSMSAAVRWNPLAMVFDWPKTGPQGFLRKSHRCNLRHMRASQWRCFWRWPLGHHWTNFVDRKYAYRRCDECGKTKSLGTSGNDPVLPRGGFTGD
jgi:hypothetical protein